MQDCALETRRLLAAADRAFDCDGDKREGSRLMWEAARAAIAAAAEARGLPAETDDDIAEAVYRMDGMVFDKRNKLEAYDGMSHFVPYSAAKYFKDYADGAWWIEDYPESQWEDDEIHIGRKSVKTFVADLIEKAALERGPE